MGMDKRTVLQKRHENAERKRTANVDDKRAVRKDDPQPLSRPVGQHIASICAQYCADTNHQILHPLRFSPIINVLTCGLADERTQEFGAPDDTQQFSYRIDNGEALNMLFSR